MKNRNRRNGVKVDVDDTRQCPFVKPFDGFLHDVLTGLRRLDGNIKTHLQYGDGEDSTTSTGICG